MCAESQQAKLCLYSTQSYAKTQKLWELLSCSKAHLSTSVHLKCFVLPIFYFTYFINVSVFRQIVYLSEIDRALIMFIYGLDLGDQ